MTLTELLVLTAFILTSKMVYGEDVCSDYHDKQCSHPSVTRNVHHYRNEWAVKTTGVSDDEAKKFLEGMGFQYIKRLGQDTDIHIITKSTIPPEHVMPNETIIQTLKSHEKVVSAAQKHVVDHIQHIPAINSLTDAMDVQWEHVNPDIIFMNDGRENLLRILQTMSDEEKKVYPKRPENFFHHSLIDALTALDGSEDAESDDNVEESVVEEVNSE